MTISKYLPTNGEEGGGWKVKGCFDFDLRFEAFEEELWGRQSIVAIDMRASRRHCCEEESQNTINKRIIYSDDDGGGSKEEETKQQ